MSGGEESQNPSSRHEPTAFGDEPIDLESSESKAVSAPFLRLPLLRFEYPFEREEGTGENLGVEVESLIPRSGQHHNVQVEDTGPSDKANTQAAGNLMSSIDEEDDDNRGGEDDDDDEDEGRRAMTMKAPTLIRRLTPP